MNKFFVLTYTKLEEDDDRGVVILSCSTDPEFIISMPIPDDYSEMIKYVLNKENRDNININTNVLGVYKTMIDSWSASDKYLSGIIMTTEISKELDDEIISAKLAISGANGELDSVISANFIASIILASMTNVGIIVSNELLERIVPGFNGEEDDEEQENEENEERKETKNDDKKQKYPKDENLLLIAKNIMSGKIKR